MWELLKYFLEGCHPSAFCESFKSMGKKERKFKMGNSKNMLEPTESPRSLGEWAEPQVSPCRPRSDVATHTLRAWVFGTQGHTRGKQSPCGRSAASHQQKEPVGQKHQRTATTGPWFHLCPSNPSHAPFMSHPRRECEECHSSQNGMLEIYLDGCVWWSHL